MSQSIFPAWPNYAEDERAAVDTVLQSGKVNYWTGEEGKCFEREFSEYIGCQFGVALANGTLALEAALYALDIIPGDEVIVPAKTFIATASSVVMCGGIPVVADIDLESNNITVETIEAVRTEKTKAVIVVHLGGWPCDMPAIMDYAHSHGLKVIEDCAQAHGAEIDGQKVGSFGHASAFSFCQDKIMSTGGEGGMLLTNDKHVWQKVWSLKDHGRNYDAVYHKKHDPGHRWYCDDFGSNWRMTEMQAAIGRVQLRKLPEWLCMRRAYAEILLKELADVCGLKVHVPKQNALHAYYRFYVSVDLLVLASKWDHNRIIEAIAAAGVPCFHGSCCEIYREKAFNRFVSKDFYLPNAQLSSQTSMCFLVHPNVKEKNIYRVIEVVRGIFQQAMVEPDNY